MTKNFPNIINNKYNKIHESACPISSRTPRKINPEIETKTCYNQTIKKQR